MGVRLRYAALALAAVLVGCDLTEVAIVDFADVVVAEVYVTIASEPADNRLRALLHGTGPGGVPSGRTYPDSRVTVIDGAGVPSILLPTSIASCVAIRPETADGSCFTADSSLAAGYEPGEVLTLDIEVGDGRTLSGSATIPGAFALRGAGETCRVVLENTRVPLRWSRSEGAWAYLSEATILGLPDALSGEGIEAPDTVYLLGLSISESDTTVSFPNELGVFDRFDLERDLAVRLQTGLPEGATADVAITAVDRNYVNWVRGGNFNPSGAVRVSSLVGDGSGVFGAAVTRRLTIVPAADTAAVLGCY